MPRIIWKILWKKDKNPIQNFLTARGGTINSNEITPNNLYNPKETEMESKKSLDAVIIPTGPTNEESSERGEKAKESQEYNPQYYIISGEKNTEKLKDSRRASIYRALRNHGIDYNKAINPKNMKIEGNSKNTLENTIESFKKINSSEEKKIGIVSYPSHLKRFEKIIEKAKQEEKNS